MLAEKPNASSTAKVPIRLTGIATIGMIVARKLPRNTNTTATTSPKAISRVLTTSLMVVGDEGAAVVEHPRLQAGGKALRTVRPAPPAPAPRSAPRWRRAPDKGRSTPPGCRSAGFRCRMLAAPSSTRATSPNAQHRAVGIGADDDVAELLGRRQPALGLHAQLELRGVAVGRAPIRPTAACTFCDWITAMMSAGARFSCTSRFMSNQMRIE